MNGPISMYNLKPVVTFPDSLDLTSTIYKMKNIYGSNSSSTEMKQEIRILPNILEQVNKLLKKPVSEVEDLKKRQEAILKRLTYLKEQMLALREELGKKNFEPVSQNDVSKKINISSVQQGAVMNPSWNGVIQEVVVHASPDSPPYALLLVNQLWSGVLRLHVSCHTHSSLPAVPIDLFLTFAPLATTPNPTIRIRLVWKHMGPDCELIISPLNHCPIRGEVNLLRYLHRTICPSSDPLTETQLDSVLDISHRVSHTHTVRDKQLCVRALNARLGKAAWLGGESMSVADIAAWSALRSLSAVELSQNMSRWQAQCCAVAGIDIH